MALDGITTSAIVSELKAALLGGRIDKIHQPLADEIRMSIRGLGSGAKKIIISANSAAKTLWPRPYSAWSCASISQAAKL